MLRIIDWRDRRLADGLDGVTVPRVSANDVDVSSVVADLISDVRTRGQVALIDQAARFDNAEIPGIHVDSHQATLALRSLEASLREAIELAIERVRQATALQVPVPGSIELAPGARIDQRFVPVSRAGVYIPGGKAVYPSSVVMNVVAAQVAGVSSIALASPPQADSGGIHPTILATASLLGIDQLYQMGGAGAIGALAYGVPDAGLLPVDVVTGPGNRFVAEAKRQVKGVVGIDSEAGPTEITVLADHTAPAHFVAADLISQAEHDELAQAILVTTDSQLATDVSTAVQQMAAQTPHRQRVIESLTGPQSAIILVSTLDDGIAVCDAIAPEHLEVITDEATDVARRVQHAGAIFVGPYTPVSAGDYMAGSNHVLPTGGVARFQSGLSALTFLRPQQLVTYTADALAEIAGPLQTFARAEHLPAHADAVTIRQDTQGGS